MFLYIVYYVLTPYRLNLNLLLKCIRQCTYKTVGGSCSIKGNVKWKKKRGGKPRWAQRENLPGAWRLQTPMEFPYETALIKKQMHIQNYHLNYYEHVSHTQIYVKDCMLVTYVPTAQLCNNRL